MAKSMTPSAEVMTDGQIDKAVAAYRAMLCKHRTELGSESAQRVLGSDGYVNEQVGVLRRRIEAVSDMIVRRVRVNRARSPQEVLDATGRVQYTDKKVVEMMPKGDGEEVEVYFFKRDRLGSPDEVAKDFKLHGLTPADPYSLGAVNAADPAFADEYPNGTQWKNASGNWCCVAFRRLFGGRSVFVDRYNCDWNGVWWFAGFRKHACR